MLKESGHHAAQPSREAPDERLQVPEIIPIFPLPTVVFFPRTYLPLHVFEPRYREMVQDAAREGRCIGMALLKEGWESDYYGNPPIFLLGCVGRLITVQPLPDGRSNILLQGVERYEIQEELYDRRYRRARIVLRPSADDRTLEPALRTKLEQDLERYIGERQNSHVWKEFLRQRVGDDSLIQRVSAYLDCTPVEKQLLLESDSLRQQTRRLLDLIHFKLHEQHGVKGWG